MDNKPIATITVTTRNRLQILQRMLKETSHLENYRDLEIIIADDASDEDVKSKINTLYPEIKIITSSKQKGYVKLRNELFKNASSEFIFFLDDDSWFENKDSIKEAVNIFKKYPNAALLSFKIRLPDGNTIPKGQPKKNIYETSSFIGAAHAIRKSFFKNKDIYDGDFFRQGEERDLAIRCLEAGHTILQVNGIVVYHAETAQERDHQFIHGYAFRNELFFYLKNFPTFLWPLFVLKCILSHTLFSVRKWWVRSYFFGLKRFIYEFPVFFKKRKPVKLKTTLHYLYLLYSNRK